MHLRDYRLEAGLTLEQVAAASNIDPGYLSRVERKGRGIEVARAIKVVAVLSDALGRTITVEEVFGDDTMTRTSDSM